MAAKKRKTTGTSRAREAPPIAFHTASDVVSITWPPASSPERAELQRLAIEWSHVVRNRTRWAQTKTGTADQDERARALLARLGIDEATRRRLGKATAITVSMPFEEEALGWEARLLPWEFVLSAATRDVRTGRISVNRWLVRQRGGDRGLLLQRVLFVESAPGRLGHDWSFREERRLVEKYSAGATFERLKSPSREQLAQTVRRFKPDVVHLAGFDTHQGLALLADGEVENPPDLPRSQRDGYLLAADNGVDPVSAEELARLLIVDGRAPHLVFCNIWNSAARVASLLVAAGVQCAVGFQDSMDDALGEMFAASFYQALATKKDVATGFDSGWDALQNQPKSLRGTGIVLWRGGTEKQLHQATGREAGTIELLPILSHEAMTSDKVPDYFALTVEPEPSFTYGLLHNDRDLFRRFVIRNLSGHRLCDLEVFVELHSNEGTYPFRRSFSMSSPVVDLSTQIRIALTSHLARTLDEVLRTSIYVRVCWGKHQIFSQTFPVTMAPVDQWTDTDADRIFLPSFVFPRDRAVTTIIKQAEHFVTALRDDPTAGFDGYQAIEPTLRNPAELVDRQVQALWYSIVYKVPASYINPPPTYALMSQRIRTPTEVVAGGFGTCIDLALLLASCLEAVEIYPVIFLLNDHAFPGYWRTPTARERFRARVAKSAKGDEAARKRPEKGGAATKGPSASWAFDRTTLDEILADIDANRLIPMEAVDLSARTSIAQAIEDGRTYFEKDERKRFLSMLDIQSAREVGVTPLPLGPRVQ